MIDRCACLRAYMHTCIHATCIHTLRCVSVRERVCVYAFRECWAEGGVWYMCVYADMVIRRIVASGAHKRTQGQTHAHTHAHTCGVVCMYGRNHTTLTRSEIFIGFRHILARKPRSRSTAPRPAQQHQPHHHTSLHQLVIIHTLVRGGGRLPAP